MADRGCTSLEQKTERPGEGRSEKGRQGGAQGIRGGVIREGGPEGQEAVAWGGPWGRAW